MSGVIRTCQSPQADAVFGAGAVAVFLSLGEPQPGCREPPEYLTVNRWGVVPSLRSPRPNDPAIERDPPTQLVEIEPGEQMQVSTDFQRYCSAAAPQIDACVLPKFVDLFRQRCPDPSYAVAGPAAYRKGFSLCRSC